MSRNTFLLIIVVIFVIVEILIKIFKPQIKGFVGEKKVSFILELLSKNNYKVFSDILLETHFGTTQIDHIVVSRYGVFVLETKNYIGWIFGSENSEKWTQNIYGKKQQFMNPIIQNSTHIKALKQIFPELEEHHFISIVAFSSNATLKVNVENSNVVYFKNILWTIWKYKNECLTEEQVKEIVENLQKLNVNSKKNRKHHIKNVEHSRIRKERIISAGICPRCGGKIVERNGKYGKFYGCSNFPDCKYIRK